MKTTSSPGWAIGKVRPKRVLLTVFSVLLMAFVSYAVVGERAAAIWYELNVSSEPTAIEVGGTAQAKAMLQGHNDVMGDDGTVPQDPEAEDVTAQVTWESMNPECATVDAAGVITGVADGTVTIKATYNGNWTGEVQVVVGTGTSEEIATPEEKVLFILDAAGRDFSFEMEPGDEILLTAWLGGFDEDSEMTQVPPENVRWFSTNYDVAAIDEEGYLEALASGETEIVAVAIVDGETYDTSYTLVVGGYEDEVDIGEGDGTEDSNTPVINVNVPVTVNTGEAATASDSDYQAEVVKPNATTKPSTPTELTKTGEGDLPVAPIAVAIFVTACAAGAYALRRIRR